MRIVALLVGVLLLVAITSSVVRTLVVPRRMRSRIASTTLSATIAPFRWLAHRSADYLVRDRILAWAGPLSIVSMLVVWLLGYLLAYGLLLFGVSSLTFTEALREAGSSLFTLGFASSVRSQLTVIDFLAAVTGPLVMGLLIGYLPTLYASYNRREVEVTMLEARAGEPNWGPEILARHAAIATVANVEELFGQWERWAADVSESHTNYPVLMYVRSSRPMRHWLIGLLAVMDAAAMYLALAPDLPEGHARIAVRQGFVALRDLADVVGIDFDPDPSPDSPLELREDEFAAAAAYVVDRGFPATRDFAAAWPHFRGWRVNYESIAYALAERLDAPPALWSGGRHADVGSSVEPRRPVDRRPRGTAGPASGA